MRSSDHRREFSPTESFNLDLFDLKLEKEKNKKGGRGMYITPKITDPNPPPFVRRSNKPKKLKPWQEEEKKRKEEEAAK